MTTPDIPAFDLTAPLPAGTTVLEASAGTGKTYTIAGLVTRWVAEQDVPLRQLLVMTFTRAATAELRDRVRQRLVTTADHLDALARGVAVPTDDPVLQAVADADAAERATRRDRLVRALSDIDVATISTIHGFCQHVLDGLGIASDLDRDAELVEDIGDLVEEVVDDLYVTTYHGHEDRPWIKRDDVLALARVVVANPTTPLVPRGGDVPPEVGIRLYLADEIRREVDRRARRRRLLSYDDLLTRLDATLRDPDRGGAACEALRDRYRVALIDEFQDTDPVQWSIVSRAFADARGDGRALVLIGDPKQAIYAFRGADVYAYLAASRAAAEQRTLDVSFRSDAALLRAFDVLFDGATYGDAGIPYRHVDHAPGHDATRFVDAPDGAALRVRVVPRHPSLRVYKGKPNADRVRELIAQDVAADVVTQLAAGPTLIDRDRTGAETGRHTLAPRDIAVLVRTHREGSLVQAALQARGVPAVVGGAGSVFATEAAVDSQRLLEAIERPASATRVRALALSAWVGWTADDVATATDDAWDDLHDQVHDWARLLRDRGVATMLRTVLLQRDVAPRLLARVGGERRLADLDHIGELLHAAATAEHLGPTTLAGWLRARMQEAGDDASDERLRRLETDDEAVQILTIHRSKGLQFPVVYCPYLWSSNTGVRGAPVFHDDTGERRIDVGGKSHPEFEDHKDRAEHEARGEELRLLYVALTRAKHQVVVHYAPAGMPEWSGLGRMLLCRDLDGQVDCDRQAPLLEDDAVVGAVGALAERAGGTISVATVPARPALDGWQPDAAASPDLDRARFTRALDEAWRRTSYSALTRLDDPEPRVGSEAEVAVKDDEALATAVVIDAGGAADDVHGLRAVGLPLADLPGGTEIGTFVHGVLEHADFAAPDLDGELRGAAHRMRARMRLDLDEDVLVAGLAAALTTPLGPDTGRLTLAGVARTDRRDEVGFELPLDRFGGDRPATVGDVADLLRTHLPADDPLAAYPDRLPDALLGRDLRGFLGGSIDLLLRRVDAGGQPVFHVADYKTNRLGVWGEPLTAWDYRPAALADAMMHGHYPIQALLYAVAAHRLLRWRLPDYDPGTHLGSVLYLFLRGMAGPDTPAPDGSPCGVFAWRLDPALVEAASDLLHGKVPA
jgi:exodeoxyribonuclease V beta subunit